METKHKLVIYVQFNMSTAMRFEQPLDGPLSPNCKHVIVHFDGNVKAQVEEIVFDREKNTYYYDLGVLSSRSINDIDNLKERINNWVFIGECEK